MQNIQKEIDSAFRIPTTCKWWIGIRRMKLQSTNSEPTMLQLSFSYNHSKKKKCFNFLVSYAFKNRTLQLTRGTKTGYQVSQVSLLILEIQDHQTAPYSFYKALTCFILLS